MNFGESDDIMKVAYVSADQWLKGVNLDNLNIDWEAEDAPDPADVLKDERRSAIYEWEEAGRLQSLEDSALSNRDRRHNKIPKFKRR